MKKIKDWVKQNWELFKAHPAIVFIIKWWTKFMSIIDTEEFLLGFPFACFGLAACLSYTSGHTIWVVPFIIWVIVLIRNIPRG